VKLYAFFRSGTSHRLRIAFSLKGLRFEQVAVDLRCQENLGDDYRWTVIVGCDIHPVNNWRILEALCHGFGADDAAANDRCGTWIGGGLDAFEALVEAHARPGSFVFGDRPTMADVHLVPQMESARRFKVGHVNLGRAWRRSTRPALVRCFPARSPCRAARRRLTPIKP